MKKLKVGIIGVGRMGFEHARNMSQRVPGMEVTAICSGHIEKARKAAAELGVLKVYETPEELCADPEVEAVAVFTNTASHVDMIRIAMEAGKHVFCEKPLAETVEKCKEAEKIIEAHPDQIFMLGFMRRFDHSYQTAKKKLENGEIGDLVLVRCYSQDPRSIIDGTLAYAPRSGGIFIDLAIHDIDLIHWLTGSDVKKLWAIGGCYEFPQLREYNDGDNVCCMMQMENNVMAILYAGRMAAHGSAVETEIVGTKGMLRIASEPVDSMVQIFNAHGVVKECYQDFITRWKEAYIAEMEAFCRCVAEKKKATPDVYDGTRATRVAFACRESFIRNEMTEPGRKSPEISD